MENEKSPVTTKNELYIKYPFWKKLLICSGDFGTFTWGFLSCFIMVFFTDVAGISMLSVSLIMLVSRIWDAAVDPVIGILSDRTHTRFGRFRPWVLLSTPAIIITFVLLFWGHPDWNDGQKFAYTLITYCLFVTAYSAMYMPYQAMMATLTQDPVERASFSGIRLALGMVSITITSYIGLPLVAAFGRGDNVKGYMIAALFMAILGTPFLLLAFASSKEIVNPPKAQKVRLRDSFKAVKGNVPMYYAVLGQFAYYFLALGRSSVYLYYFTYCIGSVGLFATFSLSSRLVMAVGSATAGKWLKLIPNKGRCVAMGYIVYGACLVLMTFTHPTQSPLFFWPLNIIGNYFCGIAYSQNFAIVPDSAEFGEWKNGVRMEGTISSLVSLGNNFGQALGAAAVAAILGVLGYVANQPQNAAVLNAITGTMFWASGILAIIVGIIFLTYKLSNKRFTEITNELRTRNSK